jgi:hypothetical protein
MGPNYFGRRSYPSNPFYANQPGLGIDVEDGDVVENLGNGLGIDLATGELEFEIAPGIDIPF